LRVLDGMQSLSQKTGCHFPGFDRLGRLLTPYFSGAAHVWLTCLMFFQAMLLLGYLYAHLLVRKLGAWHRLFLLLPLISLPLRISAMANP